MNVSRASNVLLHYHGTVTLFKILSLAVSDYAGLAGWVDPDGLGLRAQYRAGCQIF